jgi:hypothetical protein
MTPLDRIKRGFPLAHFPSNRGGRALSGFIHLAWIVALSSGANRLDPPPASVVKAEPLPEWNAHFAGKEGWIGGDCAYSVVLGPRRVLWLFGDSLLGKVKDGGRPGAVMVNNTIGIQDGQNSEALLSFVDKKGEDGKAKAWFTPADGQGWFWPQAGIRAADRLLLFLTQVDRRKDSSGAFGFSHIGQWLVIIDNPDAPPNAWRVKQVRVPFATFGEGPIRSWGSALLVEGEQVYVYGYEEQGKDIARRRMTVARVPMARLDDFAAWRFRTADGWSERPTDAVSLANGLATEFSVSKRPDARGFVAVYTENGLGDHIVGRFAANPEGPWSDPLLLYRCPEMARDKGVFCYAAKAHPWAAQENDLVISYCVNSWEFARLFKDEAVYRPRCIRVKLAPVKE